MSLHPGRLAPLQLPTHHETSEPDIELPNIPLSQHGSEKPLMASGGGGGGGGNGTAQYQSVPTNEPIPAPAPAPAPASAAASNSGDQKDDRNNHGSGKNTDGNGAGRPRAGSTDSGRGGGSYDILADPNAAAGGGAGPNTARTSLRFENVNGEKKAEEKSQKAAPAAPAVPTKYDNLKRALQLVIESNQAVFIMSILTLWALFGNDIRLAATGRESDTAFLVISSIIFFLFILELLAMCIYKPGYWCVPEFKLLPNESYFGCAYRIITGFGSFYFYLDLIATMSMIFEVRFFD
jgi:hypothetical protein